MRYRPFRSLSFWFGIPGMIFLLWAWVDSMHYDSEVSYEAECRQSDGTLSKRYTSASNSGGDVTLSCSRPDVSYKLLSHRFRSTNRDLRKQTVWLPLPSYLENRNHSGVVYYSLSIPHWFLILCYEFLWVVVLLFQWLVVKRIKARQRALKVEAVKPDVLIPEH